MSYFSLRKHAAEPESEPDVDDVEPTDADEDDDQLEPEGHQVPGLLPALWQGARNWCVWCGQRIGVGPAWGVHAVAGYAAVNYSAWVTGGVASVFLVLAFVFAPCEALERAAARLEARDKERHPWPAPASEGATEAPADPREALAQWLLDTIASEPGIHLQNLYPQMRQLPGQEGRSDADFRGALKALGVPVHRSLRIGRVAGRSGVRREDVEALLHRCGEHRVDSGGDAGQTDVSPALSGVVEGVEST